MPQASDALVLFGVTGDLAGKMLLPAVDALRARGLDIPVVGIARRDPQTATAERVRASIERHGALDAKQAAALVERLRFVEGDLADPALYDALRRTLGDARRPLYYLAIPPSLFEPVADLIGKADLADGARVAVEKPFGHDLQSALALGAALERTFARNEIFRIDHYLAKRPVRSITEWRSDNPWLEQAWSGAFVRSVQVTMAEAFGVEARGSFYDHVGALLDVVQNHVLQVVAVLAMELPDRVDGESWQAARIAAMSAIRPVSTETIVRGQYDGYRDIEGIARDSGTETFVALRFDVDTPRWRGVPFCVRAGKRLAVTMTETFARFAPPAGIACASHLRFGLGPGCVDVGAGFASRDERRDCDARELRLELGCDEDRDAYVTLLDAALRGDTAYSERPDGMLAAWRAIEPALHQRLPLHRYAQGSWGPDEAERVLPAGDRWHDPAPSA